MVATAPAPGGSMRWRAGTGTAFQEAAVREVTRLHEAHESRWWVEAVGVPVSASGRVEIVDVLLRSAGAAMALQCLRMTPRPTFGFHRRAAGRMTEGNLFTDVREVRHPAPRVSEIGACPALRDAAVRALRGAAGLTAPADGPISPAQEASPVVIPAVLTMAHLVHDPITAAPEPAAQDSREHAAVAERFWVWLLTDAPATPGRQRERHPVAIVTWMGLRHFLGVMPGAR